MGVNSLPKTVTRQHRGCDLNPGPSAPESSMLTTRLLTVGNKSVPIQLAQYWFLGLAISSAKYKYIFHKQHSETVVV